jgi:flavin reductase (DIM6/NTAB) family NADH-FMN oxidoreductase RutF
VIGYREWFSQSPITDTRYEPLELLMTKTLRPASTALFPVPAVLVTCGVERPNIITLAWVGTVCSKPPMVGIAVRPERYSHHLLREVGEFVVNLPTVDQVEAVDRCGTVSGRDHDKFALCGLTAVPASHVRVPLIADCPIHLECVVRQILTLGSHDLFLGEVVAVQAEETLIGPAGGIAYGQASLLCYLGGTYHALGEKLTVYGNSR